MSTLTTHTTTSRDSHSEGLCKFNTTSKAIEVSDGTNWLVYDYDSEAIPVGSSVYSVSYDGTDDYHVVALDGSSSGGILASSDSDVELTLSFWIYPQTTSAKNFLSWGNTPTTATPFWTIQHDRVFADGGFRSFSTNLTQNAWNHVLVTRTASNNNWNVFLNGNSSAVVTYNDSGSLGLRSNAINFYVGIGYNTATQCKIDELAFWNSDKSSSLSTIYNSGAPGNLTSLSPYGWWKMGDSDGASDGAAAGTISNIGSTANDLSVGGGSPTYTTDVP